MTVEEIVALVRSDYIDDNVAPYLWSDETLEKYVNMAEVEACRRADLLIDFNTASICEITMVADTSTYALDQKVTKVIHASISSSDYPIQQLTTQELEREIPGWQTLASGIPRWFVLRDLSSVTFIPSPNADMTATLTVARLPLNTSKTGGTDLEIPEQYHFDLIPWIVYLCFNKADVDSEDRKRAEENAIKFAVVFGDRPRATTEVNRKRIPKNMTMASQAKNFGFM